MTRDSTQARLPQIKPARLRTVHDALQRWYAVHGRRDLPWRTTDDAYAIWVSEVMLQQTQVKTVRERYYGQFLAQFPTIEALANAPRDVLMKAWEGLGYYNRAANLQKAAQVLSRNNSSLPDTFDALLALPGIGKNTAHAILAFAYRKPVAVMEANVKRVVSRLFALSSPSDSTLWELASALVDSRNPFDYNQAMMDIGATVCTKRSPLCDSCPFSSVCMGKATPELFPAAKAAKVTPVRKRIIVAWRDATGNYHVTQRQSRFLHGLYGFDEYEMMYKMMPDLESVLLGDISQTYSHFRLEAQVYCSPTTTRFNVGEFLSLAGIANLPLSRADAKVLRLLKDYDARLAKAARKKK